MRDPLVEALSSATTEEDLRGIIRDNFDAIDPTFLEKLGEHFERGQCQQIVSAYAEIGAERDPELRHAQLVLQLLKAKTAAEVRRVLVSPDVSTASIDHLLDTSLSILSQKSPEQVRRAFMPILLTIASLPAFAHRHARTHCAISSSLLHVEDAEAALRHVRQGLDALHDDDTLTRDRLLFNQGTALWKLGRHAESARVYESVRSSTEDPVQRASVVSQLAAVYGELGQWTTAKRECDEAIDMLSSREGVDPALMAHLHGNRAAILNRLGLTAAEKLDLERSLEYALEDRPNGLRPDWRTIMTAKIGLTTWHVAQSSYEAADERFRDVQPLVDDMGTAEDRSFLARLHLQILSHTGRIGEARTRASQLANTLGPGLHRGLDHLALLGEAAETLVLAGELDSAQKLASHIFHSAQELSHLELSFASSATLANVLFMRGDIQSALDWLDTAYAADAALTAGTSHGVHRFTIGLTRQRAQIRTLGVRAALRHGDLDTVLRYVQHAKNRSFEHGDTAVDAIRGTLSPDTALLEFFCAEELSFCLVTRSDRQPRLVQLPLSSEVLREVSARFRRRVRLARYYMDTDPFQQLHERLEPLISTLVEVAGNQRGWVIAPSDAGFDFPWHALREPDGRHIIENREVTLVPSGSLYASCQAKAASRPNSSQIVIAPRSSDSQAATAVFHREGQQLERALAEHLGRPPQGWHPTTRFSADIVHIAAHGVLEMGAPDFMGLDLRECGDDLLTLERVQEMKLQAKLIFLSGCDTGRVHRLTPHDPLGIVSVLLSRGATSVIASLWPVVATDEGLPARVLRFYDAWLSGCRRAEAFRQAIVPDIGRCAVYDWSAFALFGASG